MLLRPAIIVRYAFIICGTLRSAFAFAYIFSASAMTDFGKSFFSICSTFFQS